MEILIIGGTGTIGKAIVTELAARHTIIVAGHKQGDVLVDMGDLTSINDMYKSVGKVDAVIIAAGMVHFGSFAHMSAPLMAVGINSKVMGQVNLVLAGLAYMNDMGSFTLTSGVLNHDPIVSGVSASLCNGAIDGFVMGAAIEMPRGIRINAVSPTVVTESMPIYAPYFRGYESVPAARVALAYSKSVEGKQNGKIYRPGYTV
jgi:NAD(P)-dependent dehydrogenase (short-subunit alcohol dehydrogenase family)